MGDHEAVPVVCGDCGATLPDSRSCGHCGSAKKQFLKPIFVSARTETGLSLKQKRPGIKKALVELFTGRQLRNAVGDFVTKSRRFDRAADRYTEHVRADDGTVLKDVDHPLSEKRGSGSDKPELRAAREAAQKAKQK